MSTRFKPGYPLISVITVSFNSVKFIEQTLQSVLSQSYPHKEYIVIDGGSKDGTAEIIRRHGPQLAYWHSKPDRGLAHALNLGLAQATGDWLIYLHADDFFLDPLVLEKMAPHLLEHPDADVVYGNCLKMTREADPKPAPWRQIMGGPWSWQVFRRRCDPPHQAAFTNRRYFDRVGPFNEAFGIAVDYEFFLRGGSGLQAVYVPVAVSGMREGGLSENPLPNFREARNAKIMRQALPAWLAWLTFFAHLNRHVLGRLLHHLLDPFSSRISWPGRNRASS